MAMTRRKRKDLTGAVRLGIRLLGAPIGVDYPIRLGGALKASPHAWFERGRPGNFWPKPASYLAATLGFR